MARDIKTVNSRRIKSIANAQTTEPIREEKDILNLLNHMLKKYEKAKTDVKKYQAYRNYMIIYIGLNTAFRAEDLLQLRVKDINNGYVHIQENKTRKVQNYKLDNRLKEDIQEYIRMFDLSPSEYLFLGQKRKEDGKPYNYPITRQMAYKMISKAGEEMGFGFVFGVHSLRKTYGYRFIKNGGKLTTLMAMFNHSNPIVTMRYVMWREKDVTKDRQSFYIGVRGKK